jgi:hypothetical protein
MGVCPETTGLQPLYNEFISRRVVEVARTVGAPAKRAGECATNVQIISSPRPQEQLDYIASRKRVQLGYSEHPTELRKFRHVIQAWYVTGTRAFVMQYIYGNYYPPPNAGGLAVDDPFVPIAGQNHWLFGDDARSEFVYVTVIADAHALVEYRLQAVADYIAMLVLTRTALDGCNPLPSIVDLLSADCVAGARPQGITDADTAFLRALYSSNLELKVNFEKGEMGRRMLKSIEGP